MGRFFSSKKNDIFFKNLNKMAIMLYGIIYPVFIFYY